MAGAVLTLSSYAAIIPGCEFSNKFNTSVAFKFKGSFLAINPHFTTRNSRKLRVARVKAMASEEDNSPFRFLRWFGGTPEAQGDNAPSPKEGAQELVKHKVGRGETIEAIAKQYHQDVDVILEANNIAHPDNLGVGQVIIIPLTYRIKQGDTLFAIAKRFETTIPVLQDLNNLRDVNKIKEGDVIMVPQSAGRSNAGMLQ